MSRSIETYRPKELASFLGIHVKTIRRAIRTGKLKAAKENSRVFWITSQNAANWFNSLSDRHKWAQVGTTTGTAPLPSAE